MVVSWRLSARVPITVQPAVGRGADIHDRMGGAGRDEDLLPAFRPQGGAVETQLQPSIDQHHQLVRAVHKVRPDLARRVDPDAEAESPRAPVSLDSRFVNTRYRSLLH